MTTAQPRPPARSPAPALAAAPAPAPAPARPTADPETTGWSEHFTDRPQCVRGLRDHARAYLTRAHLPRPLRDDALLVISELVTNSIRHTHGPGSLRLAGGPHGLDVSVSDGGRELPVRRHADARTATDGRGLTLVAALCDTVTITLDTGTGKTVTAHLVPAAPARPAAPPLPGRTRRW
ncbi:ATP-binding protein [Kitasatospora sp. NBC_01539]|uniref:ATP-binding protein n=1 Tax=Kitasatospora sp. NBC_01539 TaxID=2903577 RepID=UPI0038601C79